MGWALEAFAAEVQRPEADLRLDRAALLIAAGEYHGLDIEPLVGLIDETALGIAAAIPLGASPRMRAQALRQRLFDDLGFHGNDADYYDPRNSYLSDVLTRRTGIPISLAVVFLEVARRIGIDAAGVGYPGHFLVKYRDGDREWIVDPFHKGAEVAAGAFREQLTANGGTSERVADYYLAAVTRRQILTRMLTNLKAIYLERKDFRRALRAQNFLLALAPWSFPDIRDRGVFRAITGDIPGAIGDLETYLANTDEKDAPSVREMVARLRAGRPIDHK